jgi:ribosome-associated translation inhibitor RaiA
MGPSVAAVSLPLQITFRNVDPSPVVEAAIRRRATRLERFSERIRHLHVIVDKPHQHQHQGNHYAIRIEIGTPSGKVVVTRDPALDSSHENFQAVLRDAFDSAVRHLESDAQRRRVARPV